MKVSELIEELQGFDEDAEVIMIAFDGKYVIRHIKSMGGEGNPVEITID